MSAADFDIRQGGNLWRFAPSDWKGRRGLSIWPHFQDRKTNEWRPCSSRYGGGGVIVPLEQLPELEAAIAAISAELRAGESQAAD